MNKFEDKRLNDYFSETECFKAVSDRPDPNDKMVRAFLINKASLEAIKQKPNTTIKMKNGKLVKLELGNYLTSNGRLLSEDVFNKHYKPASDLIKSFLKNRIQLSDSVPDIIERIHGKKQKAQIQRPKS